MDELDLKIVKLLSFLSNLVKNKDDKQVLLEAKRVLKEWQDTECGNNHE